MKNKTIDLVILLESGDIPAWQFCLVEQLLASENTSVSIVLINGIGGRNDSEIRAGSLFRAFQRHEYQRQELDPDACESRSINDLSIDSNIDPGPISNCHATAKDVGGLRRQLEGSPVDVILALGGLQEVDTLADLASVGVWYFSHDYGQTCVVDGSSIGIWEVFRNRPYMRSALVIRRSNTAAEMTAYESYSGVEFSFPLKSRNEHLWKIVSFVPRTLQLLRELGTDTFLEDIARREKTDSIVDSYKKWSLTNRRMLAPMLRYAIRRLWRKVARGFIDERWTLMYSTSDRHLDMASFEVITPPTGRFWADPFPLRRNGSNFIFFEDASIATGMGHLSVMRMDSNGASSVPTKVLDRPYHLSYPFVFEWHGVTYLVPESGENRTIDLYRCIEFPHRWKFVHTLMNDVSAYDATFVEHDEYWWMFVNVQERVGTSTWDELCVFYSDSPISQNWQPHERNPVVSDVRFARPAGRIFKRAGTLNRPSQDCSVRYGYALNINEIIELTKSSYQERLLEKIEPNWSSSVKAVHTLNSESQLTVIDVVYRDFKLPFWNR